MTQKDAKKLLKQLRSKKFQEQKARRSGVASAWLEGFEKAVAIFAGEEKFNGIGDY